MLRNYLTTAFRYFRKRPGYTILNILGLTIGISAFLLIFLYVRYEMTYDSFHEKKERIYRISSDIREPDNAFKWAVTQYPLAKTLKAEYGEVEEYVRFIQNGTTNIKIENDNFVEEDFYYVDSTVFNIFSFEILEGDPQTALKAPQSIMLSQSIAEKLFGNIGEAIGKQLEVDGNETYQVTGVFKDMPNRSHIIASAMMSANSRPEFNNTNWGGFSIFSYVLLKEGIDPLAFEQKLQQVIEDYVAPIFDPLNIEIKYDLIGIQQIHLYSDYEGEPQPTGNMSYIYIFSAIGLFMLIIASINFINLSTARASQRALEVGIRKVLGSLRSQLIRQFLSESLVFTISSLLFSLIIIRLLIPLFNKLLGLQLDAGMLLAPGFVLTLILVIAFVGILGGAYPAFFLSGFEPISVLKGKYAKGSTRNPLRKTLVIIQFIVSLFLLIGTGIIYDQLRYVKTRDLGFDQEQVLAIPFTFGEQREKWPVLRESFLRHPNVLQAATSSSVPGRGYPKNVMAVELSDGSIDERGVDFYTADFEYLETMGIDLTEGRTFSREYATDSTLAVLANEAMVKRMGWQDPLGKKIRFGGAPTDGDTIPYMKVIGVIQNYHHNSLYNPIDPLVIVPRFDNRIGLVKVSTDNVSQTLNQIEQDWAEVFPTTPFEYYFINDEFQSQYAEDEKRGIIFLIFSSITIFIACLGLLGLAAYTTVLRTKEISVRKVMGAETLDILRLMTKDYLILVAIATLPAFALTWFLMKNWLESFTYHTSINYLLFIAGFIVIAILTLSTTGFFALKASQLNPAETLKNE